ncbi:MAG: hypothetical protein IT204_19195 [Fimbriimonadaceae bacterium]|nr:hypothetical protein [Fimbriimonadaceae bacterium]
MAPNYAVLREQAGFAWSVSASVYAYLELAAVPLHDYFRRPSASVEAYRVGRARTRELFGPGVALPGPCTPHISYGHVNCLGSELVFPQGGEVGQRPIHESLAAGTTHLAEPLDWTQAGLWPAQQACREELRAAFPGESVGWGFGHEGPLTTAFELRGHDLWADLLDDPPAGRSYLAAVAASVVDYRRAVARLDGQAFPAASAGMCDDCASFIPPRLLGELVLPCWEQLYQGVTTGARSLHAEDFRPEQLWILEAAGLSSFDPSISHRLSPAILARATRVPFAWRLGSFEMLNLSLTAVREFVFQAAADGASRVFVVLEANLCRGDGPAKVAAFQAACQDVAARLQAGEPRSALAAEVRPDSRLATWDRWWEGSPG